MLGGCRVAVGDGNGPIEVTGARGRGGAGAGGVAIRTGSGVTANGVTAGGWAVGADGDAVAGRAAVAGGTPDRGGGIAGTIDVGVAGSGGAGPGIGPGGMLGGCRVAVGYGNGPIEVTGARGRGGAG